MEPVMATAIGTALELALHAAEEHLVKAGAVETANIVACVEYLRAAQSAITGLEDEVDEILIEAKMVSRFYWEKRPALYERIDRYLNRDRLRPLLDQAIEGIGSCYGFAVSDSEGFFQRAEKADTVAEALQLLKDLAGYMDALGDAMSYPKEDYAGPSGVNLPELQRIQELLLLQPDIMDEAQQRKEVAELAETTQSRRVREGLPLVAQTSRMIQELTVVFGLLRG